ncbi:hypothetical protein BO82DRAFT_383629 [Aspergillus uvarum CBS 121591]|uniref:Uncharacterized protein n=1 Tax=Aspergillus uvarum CBS 121591 TaxID=1448315 RepID=A0A319C8H5_9EURO|nr:hypothetical protein BO82DRAFT_383629 [Aspergillus uvarum CBS 121591]PYH81544.1 hypothetical protein BO82DRAFT_383629 [Aspergillus uvarum CBS 121591]
MAAANGGINMVRYFFYQGSTITPKQKKALVALDYATARDLQLTPKAILSRSELHKTTSMEGKRVENPRGWHGTFAFKNNDQVERSFHVASYGYTNGKEDFILKEATHTPEKRDGTPRGGKGSGKVVWPPEKEKLEDYVDSTIAYSHLPERE